MANLWSYPGLYNRATSDEQINLFTTFNYDIASVADQQRQNNLELPQIYRWLDSVSSLPVILENYPQRCLFQSELIPKMLWKLKLLQNWQASG